jgi:hypothetical protein
MPEVGLYVGHSAASLAIFEVLLDGFVNVTLFHASVVFVRVRVNWWDALSRDNLSFSWGCHSGLQNFLIYDTIFIYCNWVSTRWQWSVDLYESRNERAQKTIQKQKIHKIENKNTQQKTYTKRILCNVSRVLRK